MDVGPRYAPLSQLRHREALGLLVDEHLHERLGLEFGLGIGLEQRLDIGCPDVLEWILARSPVSILLGVRR